MAQMTFDLLDVLESFNITTTFYSGTLLGAARDGFMIPWDSVDVDIAMGSEGEQVRALFQFIEKTGARKVREGPGGYFVDNDLLYLRRWEQQHGTVKGKFCFVLGIAHLQGLLSNKLTLHTTPPRLEVWSGKVADNISLLQIPFGTIAGENGPQRIVSIPRDIFKELEYYGNYSQWAIPRTLFGDPIDPILWNFTGYVIDPTHWENLLESLSVKN